MAITQLTKDQHQFGETDSLSADIVAIHGILEDGLQTWTEQKSNILWLRDLIPHDLPRVRVLSYRYKAAALTSPGEGTTDRILAQAQTLVAELTANRQLDNASTRPIIFVCHGIGGLLVKRALVHSNSKRSKALQHLRSIYTSTYGILFLGTPHLGIRKETVLQSQDGNSPGPSQFAINLIKGSEMLNEITDLFAPVASRFAIYNFWEDPETSSSSHEAYIVDQESSAPTWSDVEKCGIPGTHSSMVKFGSRLDTGYRVILEAISRYVRYAPALIASRWMDEHKSTMKDRQREAKELLRPDSTLNLFEDSLVRNINEWYMVPRNPSINFTGRQKHAERVKYMLGETYKPSDGKRSKILVLFGLGGSGKTQFCLKYIEDNRNSYWGVFWIDASSQSNIDSGFASIGEQAGRSRTKSAGIHWLTKSTKPWLLILDNADDPELQIEEHCPSGGSGHILVTSRNPRAAEQARVGQLQFRGMEAEEAVNFLLKVAFSDEQKDAVPPTPKRRKLAEGIAIELGFLPLALAQAGATIRRNIYTLERYLHYYLGRRKITMSYPRVDTADDVNIITTWEIPFQRIVGRTSSDHRDAVDLMHVLAFMHFDAVPDGIFQSPRMALQTTSSSEKESPIFFQSVWNSDTEFRHRKAIGVLCDHSIIEYEPSKFICSMHPVIHNWAKERLQYSQQKQWLQSAMRILAQCISPYLEPSGRTFRALLIPHINACLQLHSAGGRSLPETLELAEEYERFSYVFMEQSDWASARRWQQKVIAIRRKLLGKQNHETLHAQRNLSQTLWNMFEIREVLDTQVHIWKTLMWHRGSVKEWATWPLWSPNHLPYLVALDDLTRTLWLAGQREKSLKAGERAVAGLTSRLGPQDPKTLTAMFNLARTYLHLGGKQVECHQLLVQVLKLQKHYFGLHHPDTMMTRNEVGVSLCASKRHLFAAQRIIENVLQDRRRILGAEHAYTLWSVNDLSKIYVEQGRPAEAVQVLEDILPIVKRTLGEMHVGMALTRSNLSKAYFEAGRPKDAEETVLLILNTTNEDHPDRIHTLYGYARLKVKMGKLDHAEKLCLQMMDLISRKKLIALDNPRTIEIGDLLIGIYRSQGREKDVNALKSQIPGTDISKNVDHVDPYAIRKGSGTLSNSAAMKSFNPQNRRSNVKVQHAGS
ncbi:unnamed protein product [Periconia digitata]|uniref:Uncharacterized protein n=1 Tax=Periconia digitata TaxID=1303443 RepID=A0A9W4URT0_9PLEO|nr:unnamed protein product [Periconia digitata]